MGLLVDGVTGFLLAGYLVVVKVQTGQIRKRSLVISTAVVLKGLPLLNECDETSPQLAETQGWLD